MADSTERPVAAYWNDAAKSFNGAASHVRHGAAWRAVLAAAFGSGGPRDVVDLGTGTGACALIAAELGHRVTGIDGSAGMLAAARAEAARRGLRVSFVEAMMDRAGLADGCADIVTLRNVLWTLERPDAALRLARRILRPGGCVVVSDALWRAAHGRSRYDPALAGTLPFHGGLTEVDARGLLAKAGFGGVESFGHLFPSNPYETMGSPDFFVLAAVRDAPPG